MGYAKRMLEEAEEFGYEAPNDAYICPGCVTDAHLAQTLGNALEDEPCSYCGAPRAAEIVVLLKSLGEVVRHSYTDPAEELPYDGREGGYQGVVSTGDEIVDNLDEWTDNDQLRQDAAGAFSGSSWCKRDYFGLDPYEALKFGWDRFCQQVKHRTRYLFLQELGSNDERDPRYIPPGRMLEELGALFHEYNLFRTIPTGYELVRARVVDAGERPATAETLGTARCEYAIYPNRMSPAGIPMFYGAVDEQTAVLETYDPLRGGDREIALARFATSRPLVVLDLTSLPEMPSQFDPTGRDRRLPLTFLRSFERDVTSPIARDEGAHTEYVPTQIVTEFVRHRLRTSAGDPINGLVYRSSRDRHRIAVVLFAESEHCGPRIRRPLDPEPYLNLVNVRYANPTDFAALWVG